MAGFAKFDGIDGESVEAQHDGWVEFLSLEWGVARPTSSTGQSRRRGSVVIDDLELVFDYEKAMPKLLEACLRGQHLSDVQIELTAASGGSFETFLSYKLQNVMVSSYRVEAPADTRPTVTISLSFREITVTYTEYDGQGDIVGTVETSWVQETQRRSQGVVSAPAKKAPARKTAAKKRAASKTAAKKTAAKRRDA